MGALLCDQGLETGVKNRGLLAQATESARFVQQRFVEIQGCAHLY